MALKDILDKINSLDADGIKQMYRDAMENSEIAEAIGKNKSMVSKEIKRNKDQQIHTDQQVFNENSSLIIQSCIHGLTACVSAPDEYQSFDFE